MNVIHIGIVLVLPICKLVVQSPTPHVIRKLKIKNKNLHEVTYI